MGGYAPPSQPLPSGYAPGYSYPPAPYPYYAPPIPPAPPKRRIGLIVGIVAAVVVLLLVCGGGTFALIALEVPTTSTPTGGRQPTTGVQATTGEQSTSTSSAPTIYSNSFASDAEGWPNDTHCALGDGGYHVHGAACFAPIGSQTNVDVTVQVKQVSGPPTYVYGVSVRHIGAARRYDIGIASDGKWVVLLCTGTNSDGTSNCTWLVNYTANSAIHGGLNVTNTLEVKAEGSQFQLEVNNVQVGNFTDSTYPSGSIGLFSGSPDMDVVFSQMTVQALT